ncbi:hypothetical protein [Hoeflea sp. TYP-13]|uniref:hypothetical protein n=1 Tax=Hoeflea sp. TYP-13 TaxID=3230023 RepID=UPI0034C6B19F
MHAPHAAFAAQGLQAPQAEAFLAAHGLHAPQAAFAAHGLHAAGFLAAHGFAAHVAALGVASPADNRNVVPAAPASANGTTATVVSNFVLIVAISISSA